MNIKHITTIWKKELRDTIRDRRTMVSMILIPMILMPAILLGSFKLIQSQEASQSQKTLRVAVSGQEYAPQFFAAIKGQSRVEIVPVAGDLKQAVSGGDVDAAVSIPSDFQFKLDKQEPVQVTFISKSTNLNASSIYLAFNTVVAEFNSKLIQARFGAQHIDPSVLTSVSVVPEDAATQKEVGGFVLGFLIPLFIVMWAIIGGQYTAIDVSAGEKERKTLEALLLTPVKRIDIVLGKFFAVSTVALVSIVTAIGSLYFSFIYAGKAGIPLTGNAGTQAGAGMMTPAGFSFSVEPQTAALLFLVSIFLVMMFSAIILSISIFAKSFKEAESYISPAYIIVILPVVFVNAVPGFQPTLIYFAVPAVNAILLFKELLLGVYDWGHIVLTLVSLAIYSLLAIYIASRIYSKESVLFKD